MPTMTQTIGNIYYNSVILFCQLTDCLGVEITFPTDCQAVICCNFDIITLLFIHIHRLPRFAVKAGFFAMACFLIAGNMI